MDAATLFIKDLAMIMIAAAICGWIAKRLGLSPIVGYLVAGILVGTPEVMFPYVSDPDRIQVLSQLGLIFLLFSIGLGLRIRKLLDFGFGLLLATALTAILVLNLIRALAPVFGLGADAGLFLAAMFMVSSSAIIGKVLQDSGLTHQRFGQVAMGMTLLEDIVAVVALTFLGSMATGNGETGTAWATMSTIGLLAGFALLLLIIGIVLMPRLLHRFNRMGASELETILVTGLLFALSLAAVMAGYSLALGAFLLGVVIAETPRLASIQRAFSGLKDVFSTVFFVAIGMLLDVNLIPEALPLIIIGTLVCTVGRALCATVSLLAVCEDNRTAVRAGLSVTPMGEFSFIIVSLGVGLGYLPEKFQVMAVGIAILTGILAPILIGRSEKLADKLTFSERSWPGRLLTLYRHMWDSIGKVSSRSVLWKSSRKRFVQIGVELLVVTALLTFARPIYASISRWLPETVLGLPVEPFYWGAITLLCAGPLLAIWRNAEVIMMIFLEALSDAQPNFTGTAPLRIIIQTCVGLVLLLWLGSILPLGDFRGWVFVVMIALLVILIVTSWRRINRWHSTVESTLQNTLGTSGSDPFRLASIRDWGLTVDEFSIPDYSAHSGRSIGDIGLRRRTGCSVISIERMGHRLTTTSPQTHLFPGDNLLLLGEPPQIAAAKAILEETPDAPGAMDESAIHEIITEVTVVPTGSLAIGRSLAQLNWPRLYGVQIAGIRRSDTRYLQPGPQFILQEGDELLMFGTSPGIRRAEITLKPEVVS